MDRRIAIALSAASLVLASRCAPFDTAGETPGAAVDAARDGRNDEPALDAAIGDDASMIPDAADVAATNRYANEVLADSPAAYWRLGEGSGAPRALDATGSGHDGVYSGDAVRGAPGLLPDSGDRATTFARDGGAGRVSVPRASALEPTEAITIECWFQPTVTISTLTTLVGYGADSVEPYLLGVEDGLGAYQFFLANSGSTGGAVMTFANTHAAIGVSVHLVATYDRANLRLYVNGELDSSAAATGEIGGYAGSAGLSIGADVDGQRGAEGTIDEVAVYNRALPPERIRAHFAAR